RRNNLRGRLRQQGRSDESGAGVPEGVGADGGGLQSEPVRDPPLNLLAQHRSWEWELFDPLVGSSMLELGNKKKAAGDAVFTYKSVFKSMGFRHVSVDTNGLDGAMPK